MPKFSGEGRLGLLMEIVVIILERLHVTAGYVIWPLFGFGALLIADWIWRGEWKEKHEEAPAIKKRQYIYGGASFICLFLLAVWLIHGIKSIERYSESDSLKVENTKPRVQVPTQETPEKESAKNEHKSGRPPKSEPPITTGPISPGPCSNVQIGGSGNQATTNCVAPPDRDWKPTQRQQGQLSLHSASVHIFAVQDQEAIRLSQKIADTLSNLGWAISEIGTATYNRPVNGLWVQSRTEDDPTAMNLRDALGARGKVSPEMTPQWGLVLVIGANAPNDKDELPPAMFVNSGPYTLK